MPDSLLIVKAYQDLTKKDSLQKAKAAQSTINTKPQTGRKALPKVSQQNFTELKINGKTLKDSLLKAKAFAQINAHMATDSSYTGRWGFLKPIKYVMCKSWDASKLAGFLLTAMAICLGAPFWFDLLNKLVNIRATGKREENNNSSGASAGMSPEAQPVTVNIGNQQAGEGAVG